ncbi:zinc-ribbon and DUF3426 domain-containing protein [Methylomonas sp. MK1]|uniref:zinc-ribbon and DUF3426 domain-containing protein n=1 Tax=Methylomonas sp. MK1 TaxID=1131552 RepID=UPI00037A01D5|nr:zinc-ribbon and DUF3426 domain-containing protein [Methylomonas sp. MK1]
MYSRCPHCAKQHEVTVEHLRQARGLLDCSVCGKSFDALRFLSEDDDAVLADESPYPDDQISEKRPQTPAVWFVATNLALLLLLAQILYFEDYRLTMQPQLRAGLDKVCAAFACRLPPYKNLEEFSVSHSDLRVQSDSSYLFSALLSNQAPFAQVAPDLKLSVLNFNGEVIAERVFRATEYLLRPTGLAPEQTVEIRLAIVAPAASIGGYTFTLL